MRDVNRIPKILSQIETVWKLNYDMRFFQFLSYLASLIFERINLNDLFYLEDDKLSNILEDIIKERLSEGENI